jgi:hypothetical protein
MGEAIFLESAPWFVGNGHFQIAGGNGWQQIRNPAIRDV